MPTPLIFYSIKQSFWCNSFLWKTPIGWDGKTNRMTYDSSSHLKYFPWYFNVFVIFYGITSACSAYVVYWQYYAPREELTIAHSVQYALLIPAGVVGAGIALVVMLHGQEAVHVVNGILEFHDMMEVYRITGYHPSFRIEQRRHVFTYAYLIQDRRTV